ncbi:hypothetical protein E7Z59_01110 [Robertkochia marina]|uniref:DUF2141 domain-containing protein n=1 Tax=Robertkochia marina TaxID=1227945 RepID=A0A4S3M1K3_9FLAO|nr:hypothetical protein [Robertkochia marina]THD68962.1 hypothetical protein E7Z59_01110 [Robertkochia marina]TRZ44781.1 hypothetical protein D3A96_07065 [Robertkochia marina]
MKKILLLILLLSFSSCLLIQDGIRIQVENNSDDVITEVKFFTSDSARSTGKLQLGPGDYFMDFHDMSHDQSDGNYKLQFKRIDGEVINIPHGYYTNGGALESRLIFDIKNDTVIVESKEYF